MRNDNQQNQFQTVGSLLAFLLPILQIFLSYLPDKSKDIFLIKEQFLFVSIIAAVFSYVLILIFKNIGYFDISFPTKNAKKYQEYIKRQNDKIYSAEEIQTYLKETPLVGRPFHLTFNNVTNIVLLPLMILSWLLFFWLGLSVNPTKIQPVWIFLQSISYIALVSLTALSLAVFYLKDNNFKKWKEKQETLYFDVVQLAYENSAFEEFPNVTFITQFQLNISNMITVMKVNNRYYRVITDPEATKLQSVEKFDSLDELREIPSQ